MTQYPDREMHDMFAVFCYVETYANTYLEQLHMTTRELHSQNILHYFSVIADKYDFMNAILSFGLYRFWNRRAIAGAGIKRGERVLDVCGGTGALSVLAAEAAGPEGSVVLYDFCPNMIRAGKRRYVRSRTSAEIHFVCGDALNLAAGNKLFDAALIGFGLRNLSDMEQGVREILRVLKPGGRLVCLEFSHPRSAWFRPVYEWYCFHVIPFAGKWIVGSREAYLYLPRSIKAFPHAEQLGRMLRSWGLQNVYHRLLCNGIAAVHVGSKRDRAKDTQAGQETREQKGRS